MKSFPSKNQGFSLIEILLVIGIIAVLAIAAFLVFPSVQASSRANTEQSNIMSTAAGVKNLYSGRYGTAAAQDLTGQVNQARIFPSSMNGGDYAAATVINSSWGTPVTVTGNVGTFDIDYSGMSPAVCLKLVPGLLQNFEAIDVSGAALTRQSTPGDVVTACQSAADDITLTLTAN